jgi:hypothetical protein
MIFKKTVYKKNPLTRQAVVKNVHGTCRAVRFKIIGRPAIAEVRTAAAMGGTDALRDSDNAIGRTGEEHGTRAASYSRFEGGLIGMHPPVGA